MKQIIKVFIPLFSELLLSSFLYLSISFIPLQVPDLAISGLLTQHKLNCKSGFLRKRVVCVVRGPGHSPESSLAQPSPALSPPL